MSTTHPTDKTGAEHALATDENQYATPIGPRNDLPYRVQCHLERYIAFANPAHAPLLALWTLHTHAFDAAYVTPYIYVSSVDPGAGKTSLMETIADLARNPQMAGNISASYIFRVIDSERPTFIIDEVDTIYSGSKNEELRSVLNSGYLHSGHTLKTINGEPTQFSTFCPKLLGGIDNGRLPETVADRCLRIRLRKLSGDKLADMGIRRRNVKRLAKDEALANLRTELAKWATIELVDQLSDIEPPMIEGLSARQWDIAEPLMQIAHMFHIHEEARAAIVTVFQGEKVETEESRILTTARELLDESGADRLTTAQLADVVGYTPDRLSRALKPLGVNSRPMKIAGNVVRGYYRAEFESAWERYL